MISTVSVVNLKNAMRCKSITCKQDFDKLKSQIGLKSLEDMTEEKGMHMKF